MANVTTTRPFIFFHQRKAGGSSIRATLHAGAKKKNLKSYIPCLSSEKKLRCDTYTLPEKLTAKNAAVIYGGHIPWGEPQNKYERFLHDEAGSREFSCATNFREPLSRVASCLHFRFPEPFENKCITDMDTDVLLQYLKKPDTYGSSCLNEPFRIMSGIRTDVFADKLDVCTPHKRSELISGVHPEFMIALTLTLKHIMKCSPLILEAPESYTMAQQRFDDASGVRFVTRSGGMVHLNAKRNNHTCGDAKKHPWQQKNLHLMLCVTAVEQMLYRAVVQKTECVANGIPPDKCGQGIETTHISPFDSFARG